MNKNSEMSLKGVCKIVSVSANKNKQKIRRYFDSSAEECKEQASGVTCVQKTKIEHDSNEDYIPLSDRKEKTQQKQKFKGTSHQVKAFKKEGARKPQNRRTIIPKLDLNQPEIPSELLEKNKRGQDVVSVKGVKTHYHRERQQRKEIYLEYAAEQAARTGQFLTEENGFLEALEGEVTASFQQQEICRNVNIQAASKHFKLNLEFGPYRFRYSKNGRHLLLGGRKGHVASFDWITKKLHCEFNAMEEVADVTYFHQPNIFACAQNDHVFIYDNQGTELHCIKALYRVNRMEFLPYHFLLATGNRDGFLSWLDVSIGELISNYNTKAGNIQIMRQNPSNGVICVGCGRGVVSMWSPKVRYPLAKLLCHSTSLTSMAIDPKGQHLVTAGLDKLVKVWDIRNLEGPLCQYKTPLPVNEMDISQRGVLAFSQGNYARVYNNLISFNDTSKRNPYLTHHCSCHVHSLRFCPYEDILGVSTSVGFESLLMPGSGEANYDAIEDNPYETTKQRREREVHALLEKIPAELITLDPTDIAGVDEPTLQEKVDAKRQLFFIKPPKIDFNSTRKRRRMKGKGGSAKAARSKQIVKDVKRQVRILKSSCFPPLP